MATTRRAFLTANWRNLVMLNYEVAPELLRPLVPAGTVLDLFKGRTLFSIVGFRFLDTRVLGVAIPFHRDFDEVNLRFYVRRELPNGEVRRGVVFVRELVPRLAIALVARAIYNEPYRAVPMNSISSIGQSESPGRIQYAWRTSGHWQHVGATAVAKPGVAAPESEATFVTEHLWGYTRQRDGGTVEYEVQHPPWRVWNTISPTLDADVLRIYGSAFAESLAKPPRSAFFAEGSPVMVFSPTRIA